MSEADVRWKQRFSNFKKAHAQVTDALVLMGQRSLSDLERQGVIKAFEFTYELSWKLLRDYLLWQGVSPIAGSRDAIREAFRLNIISDGHAWMAMLQDRNKTVHIYDESTIDGILGNLQNQYAQLFDELDKEFDRIIRTNASQTTPP